MCGGSRPRSQRALDPGGAPRPGRAVRRRQEGRGEALARQQQQTQQQLDELAGFRDEPLDREVGLFDDPSGDVGPLSPAEVRRFLSWKAGFTYEVTEVSADGSVCVINVTRAEVLAATSLRPRDLRSVAVQGLPGLDSGPMFLSRKGVLLLGLGGVKAIVEPHRALLFGPATRGRLRILRVLKTQRRTAPGSSFRMSFVESALLAYSRQLDSQLLEVRKVVEPKLQAPPVLLETELEEVRQRRRRLSRCGSQASAVSATLLARLDGEGVDALLGKDAIGSHVRREEALEEWEAMLEVYLRAFGDLSRECTALLRDIEDFEGSASLALQARRLSLEQFELSLVIASVSISASNLVPGYMGMNVPNGLEQSDIAFVGAVTSTVGVLLSLFLTLRFIASRQGFLS